MQDEYSAPEDNEEARDQEQSASDEQKKEEEKKGMEVPPVPSTGVDVTPAAEPEAEVDVGEEGEEVVEVLPAPSTGVDTASAVKPNDDFELELGAEVDATGVPEDEEEQSDETSEE